MLRDAAASGPEALLWHAIRHLERLDVVAAPEKVADASAALTDEEREERKAGAPERGRG